MAADDGAQLAPPHSPTLLQYISAPFLSVTSMLGSGEKKQACGCGKTLIGVQLPVYARSVSCKSWIKEGHIRGSRTWDCGHPGCMASAKAIMLVDGGDLSGVAVVRWGLLMYEK